MRNSRFLAALTAAVMILGAAGCGSNSAAPVSEAPAADTAAEAATTAQKEEAPAEAASTQEEAAQDGQNPAMNFVGAYSDENGKGYSLLLEATDEVDGVYVTIGYPHDSTYTYWEMYGKIADNVITYQEGAEYAMNPSIENPEEAVEELVYYDGTGSFEITADNKITWKDDKENAGEGLVFAWDEELNSKIADLQKENEPDDDYIRAQSVMNWAGSYTDRKNKNRSMVISTSDEGGSVCSIVVTETTDESLTTTWTMSGKYDEETMSFDYTDCVKKEITLDGQGNPASEKTIYENGEGRFVINDADQTIEWSDEVEDAGKGSLFEFKFDYDNPAAGGTEVPGESAE